MRVESFNIWSLETIDVTVMSSGDLVRLEAQLRNELLVRRIVRSNSDLMGEYGEYLTQRIYGGYLPEAGTKSFDVADSRMGFLQVKVRTLLPGIERIFHFHDFNFDFALCLRFSALDNQLDWAREISAAELKQLAVPHKHGFRVRTKAAQIAGKDVTSEFQREIASASKI